MGHLSDLPLHSEARGISVPRASKMCRPLRCHDQGQHSAAALCNLISPIAKAQGPSSQRRIGFQPAGSSSRTSRPPAPSTSPVEVAVGLGFTIGAIVSMDLGFRWQFFAVRRMPVPSRSTRPPGCPTHGWLWRRPGSTGSGPRTWTTRWSISGWIRRVVPPGCGISAGIRLHLALGTRRSTTASHGAAAWSGSTPTSRSTSATTSASAWACPHSTCSIWHRARLGRCT